jgi:hypothetical protein
MNKSFLVLSFKKEQKKHFFLKKEAKTLVLEQGRVPGAACYFITEESMA